jgi:selenocysteine lyase/cysteine desulfurase
VDEVIARARESVGILINARASDEIGFGMNATSFLRLLSLATGCGVLHKGLVLPAMRKVCSDWLTLI